MHCTHAPGFASTDVHTTPAGQLLPLTPRQPSWQVCAWLQILPLSAVPHCASERHSTHIPGLASMDVQTRLSGHSLPPIPRQPTLHVLLAGSQTLPAPQSESLRHSTHWPMAVELELQS